MASEPATVRCPLCGGDSAPAGTKRGYEVRACGDCGFWFVHPFPSAQALNERYSDNYRGSTATFYPKLRSRRRRAFVKSIRFWRHVAGRRVLDIGCGGGIMVDAFRRVGADAHGMDISANSIAFARNRFPRATFYCEDFGAMARRDLVFDFMFTAEVMEHLAGPHDCLRMIDALSRPGTVIYVSTPDIGHPVVPETTLDWSEICPPEHLQWFNRANMTRLFDGYGFDLLKAFAKRKAALSLLFRKRRG